jgi:ribonuclease D
MRAYRMVDTTFAWAAAQRALAASERLAFDVEADGFHRYPERVALVQVATPSGECFLLDPLALEDLRPLGEILGDATIPKVFHAADYDVRSLHRDFGFHVRGLFDSAIAAQFLGAGRTGLANVVAEKLGITLDKPKRLQRLDWSVRPLPDDALDYAASDVRYLLALHDELLAKLRDTDREDWVMEECVRLEAVRFSQADPPEVAVLQIPGCRDLTETARAVLLEMFVFRDRQARATGKPPYRVLASRMMVSLAEEAAGGKVPKLPRMSPSVRSRLGDAIERGLQAPPLPWPRNHGRNPWDAEARRRLVRLKGWRTEQAAALGLEAGIVWPAEHLKRMALNPDADPKDLDTALPPDVRRWQWRTIGPALINAWAIARRPVPVTDSEPVTTSEAGLRGASPTP